jgi:hypothetical protein
MELHRGGAPSRRNLVSWRAPVICDGMRGGCAAWPLRARQALVFLSASLARGLELQLLRASGPTSSRTGSKADQYGPDVTIHTVAVASSPPWACALPAPAARCKHAPEAVLYAEHATLSERAHNAMSRATSSSMPGCCDSANQLEPSTSFARHGKMR